MNIRFTKLGHEECEKCETFKLHNSQHNEQNLDVGCDACTTWKIHIDKAKLSREKYREYANQSLPDCTLFVFPLICKKL